jgi:hypothetical protein
MGSVFDSLFTEGAPLLDETFGEAATVVYTSPAGVSSGAITAILGAVRQQRITNETGSLLEQTRTIKIRRSLLATVQARGKITLGGADWGIVSEPIRTATYWELEIATADWLEFRSDNSRQL